jgi:hypothetical protein
MVLAQPPRRQTADSGLLGQADRFSRTSEAAPGADLGLAEDQGTPEGDDQVQLAVTAPPVAVQDPVTPILIPVRSPLLSE